MKRKKVRDYCADYAAEFREGHPKFWKHDIRRLEREQADLAMAYAFNKFLLADEFQNEEKTAPRPGLTLGDFAEWTLRNAESWRDDSILKNLDFSDYEGNFNKYRVEHFISDARWFLKHTDFFNCAGETRWFPTYPTTMAGNDGDLQYYLFCPRCETIVRVSHADFECNRPVICPTCAGEHLKSEYYWKFWKKGDEGYDDVRYFINWEISWNKKYYFKIGDPHKPLHFGKWYPRISIPNKYYSDGKKTYYFMLGCYPYQMWLELTRSPYRLYNWFEKRFRKKKYAARMERLFGNNNLNSAKKPEGDDDV
jgi:hypothetical protein